MNIPRMPGTPRIDMHHFKASNTTETSRQEGAIGTVRRIFYLRFQYLSRISINSFSHSFIYASLLTSQVQVSLLFIGPSKLTPISCRAGFF
jgi:hypothetical protein